MLPACRCRPLPVLPAILLLILPKCPLCVGAWFGLFGALGVSSWMMSGRGIPLGIALLSVAVGALAVRAIRSRDLRPVPPGLFGSLALLAGRYLNDVWLLGLGTALLLLACTIGAARREKNKRKVETTYDESVCR